MDWPKSVAGVGLVAGKFVDEDKATGTPGSLIPAEWGNAVTEEILAVMTAAAVPPVEGQNDQLLSAIVSLGGGQSRTVTASKSLAPTELGLVLVDAAAGALTITLPHAATGLRVTLRRADATANAAVIMASGDERLMLDTSATAAGQVMTELLFAGDYLCLQADAAGHWWCIGQAQLPGGMASGFLSYTAPGSQVWSVPAVLRSGRRRAKVTVIGAGGGGGGVSATSASQCACSAAGGGGGAAISRVNLAGVASVNLTIGAAGAPGGAGALKGGAGGTSSFGAYLSATGGEGGAPGFASAGNASAVGGLGGIGAGGDMNLAGSAGSSVIAISASVSPVANGNSGASILGGSARAHFNGSAPGAGGGVTPSPNSNAAQAGTAGAPGAILIEW